MSVISRLKHIAVPVCAAALAAWSAPAAATPSCNPLAKISPTNGMTVAEGASVQINGQPSQDATTFRWTQVSGPTVTLNDATIAKPTFTAPAVGVGGDTVVLKLTVTGCSPVKTDFINYSILVQNVNSPPTVSAIVSPLGTVDDGTVITLTGSATDPEGDPLIYSWAEVIGGVLQSPFASTAETTVTPHVMYPLSKTFQYRFTATEDTASQFSSSTDVYVTVRGVNDKPSVSVTCTPTVLDERDGFSVTSSTSDADDGIVNYEWSQLSGPGAGMTSGQVHGTSLDFANAPYLGARYSSPGVEIAGYDTMVFELKVTDAGGLFDTAQCSIQVRDVTGPVVTVPTGDVTAEAQSASGANVTFDVTAVDAVYGAVDAANITCTPASGSLFPLTDTLVSCSATDPLGNVGSNSFTVWVLDTTPPSISVANKTAEATGPSGAAVSYTVTATDLVDGSVTPSCLPASGSTFALGTTTVNCTATDAHSNTGSNSFTVTVVDTTPPLISVANKTAEATTWAGAVVSYTVTATDLVDGSVTPSCLPASGSTFALGTTTVNCTATDAHSNTGSNSFTITVVDTTPPVITAPASFSVDPTFYGGALVTYPAATAQDAVDGGVTPSCGPPSGTTFGFGPTTVTCTAVDSHSNSASATFTVTVNPFKPAGFFQPVIPGVVNSVKGGATVPLKWQIFGQYGQITDVLAVKGYGFVQVPCGNAESMVTVDVTFTTTGGTSLRYDTTGAQFVLNWQTPKKPGSCWVVSVGLNDNKTALSAAFMLK